MPVQAGSPRLANKILFKTDGLRCMVDGVRNIKALIRHNRQSLLFKKKALPQSQAAMMSR